jgi:aminoglycoside phosphotransferase (APT) family kinase protein
MCALTPTTQAIARGRHAEFYAIEPDRVLKLFRPGFSRPAIEAELRHAVAAHAAGIPTPRPERIIESNGRSGIVFERCAGPTLLQLIAERTAPPPRLAQMFFGVQRAIHAAAPAGFPDIKQLLAGKIARAVRVSAALRQRALEVLARLPAGSAACHGDFHPANVIMAERGPVVVDWVDAGIADPAFDAARSLLLLRYARPGAISNELRAAFVASYEACLREAWSGRMQAIERWHLPLAVARLAEPVEEIECQNLLKLVSTILSASPS